MAEESIVIGGASGYWGDTSLATPQLLASAQLDYLVYDYLAEVTMSILARARNADESKGYAVDFVSAALAPNLGEIAHQGVKVIANAGGVNLPACAAAIRALIAEQGLELKVAAVIGDDLLDRRDELAALGPTEMFTAEAFPDPEAIASINAYLGAFPIAQALAQGADIVVTGRCVDSAVTLAACIHAFGWGREEYDKLAQGSLAGHILECGTQATGGNFTDWETVVDTLPDAGYPMAEVKADGSFVVTKPENTGGIVNVGTVAEQMLYEIGNPQAYLLPDVACNFAGVELEQIADNRVRVNGATGLGAPDSYKVSATWTDGFRGGQIWTMYGRDADIKGRKLAQNIFRRCSQVLEAMGLPDFAETSFEIIGAETHYGSARKVGSVREVDVKIAARHPSPGGIGVLIKEMTGIALSAPPGLSGFAGARPKPSPVVRLFSLTIPKGRVQISVDTGDELLECNDVTGEVFDPEILTVLPIPSPGDGDGERLELPLEALAWGRSGDKGSKANIGIISRHGDFLPWIATAMTEARVAQLFEHFLEPDQEQPVERFYMPSSHALNFLLHEVLGGGGVASLRSDPQGKGYAQLLLGQEVSIPRALAEKHGLA